MVWCTDTCLTTLRRGALQRESIRERVLERYLLDDAQAGSEVLRKLHIRNEIFDRQLLRA
jgi:hypothetical protein